MDELRLTVALTSDEYDGDVVDVVVERVAGLRADELGEVRALLPAHVSVRTEPGSIGKGYSGPGAVLAIAGAVLNDGASFLAWGAALLQVAQHLRQKNANRRLNIDDPRTIAAVAAARATPLADRLRGTHFLGGFCLTGGGPGMGVDARDTWVSAFGSQNGWVVAIYSSPSGLFLGSTIVSGEWDPSMGHRRDQAEVNRLFRRAQTP